MATKLEITEYYELVALHKALHAARFARDPLIPYLSGSPYLADLAKRVVDTLSVMEIERGKPERASDWQVQIDPDGEVWQIAIRDASAEPDFWNRQTDQQKIDVAKIFLSPFVFSDETLAAFIKQVDERTRQ